MELMFEAKEPVKTEGKIFEKVNMNVLETNSLNPRTNKRKLRKYLVSVVGIAPCMVKQAIRDMDMTQIPRRNLKEMEAWIRKHAPEVPADLIRKSARAIKANPASPIGIIDPVARRNMQFMIDEQRRAEEEDAIDKAFDETYGEGATLEDAVAQKWSGTW